MRTRVIVVAGVVSALSSTAFAGLPAWCKGYDSGDGEYGIFKNSLQDDDRTNVELVVNWSCSTKTGERDKQKADIDAARADVSKRLFMNDADWSDAVDYAKDHGPQKSSSDWKVLESTLAAFTPFDQYVALREPPDGFDPLYLADALEPNLSELGRLGFLASCKDSHHVTGGNPEPVYFSVCLTDLAKFDPNKAAEEIRSDKAHPAWMHTQAHIWMGSILAEINGLRDDDNKLIKKDDAYGKVNDVAAKGRAEWEKTLGSQKDLLALVQQVDSAHYFHSKKQYAGCEEKSEKALADAVSTIPAKTFTGLHDNDDGIDGFAHDSAMKIVSVPLVNIAANAFVLCEPDRAWSYPLRWALQSMPGYRGPRSAAFSAVYAQKFELDDTTEGEIKKPHTGDRPYSTSYGMLRSWGGVVSTMKPGKDESGNAGTTLAQPKSSIVTEDCVKSHSTNKLVGWDTADRPVYESICDKTAAVKHDTTPRDVTVNPATAKVLKAGMRFSAVFPREKGLPDIFAVWPSKTAKLPSMVLGGTVK